MKPDQISVPTLLVYIFPRKWIKLKFKFFSSGCISAKSVEIDSNLKKLIKILKLY